MAESKGLVPDLGDIFPVFVEKLPGGLVVSKYANTVIDLVVVAQWNGVEPERSVAAAAYSMARVPNGQSTRFTYRIFEYHSFFA